MELPLTGTSSECVCVLVSNVLCDLLGAVHLILLFLPTASFFLINALMAGAGSPFSPELCQMCVRDADSRADRLMFACVAASFICHALSRRSALCVQRAFRLRRWAISQSASKGFSGVHALPVAPRFSVSLMTFSADGL